MDITFLWPLSVIALLLPFVVWRFTSPINPQGDKQALCVPFFRAIQNQIATGIHIRRSSFALLFFFAFVALVVAAMRPVSFDAPIYIPTNGRQMMLVLDVSGSMAEPDFIWNNKRTTRLNAVQNIADDFIENRKGDAVGLTIFGTQAYLYTPLTLDTKTAAQMLREIGVGMAGEKTAIGDALLVALKQMTDIPSDKKVIVLLSDGYANAGIVHPKEAIEMAQKMGVKIHTIAMGSDKKTVQSFFFQHEINPSADLDEVLLEQMAKQTGGTYFRVKTTEDLKQVYDALNQIEPSEMDGQTIRPKTELFFIPLLIAMALFFIGLYLKEVNA